MTPEIAIQAIEGIIESCNPIDRPMVIDAISRKTVMEDFEREVITEQEAELQLMAILSKRGVIGIKI